MKTSIVFLIFTISFTSLTFSQSKEGVEKQDFDFLEPYYALVYEKKDNGNLSLLKSANGVTYYFNSKSELKLSDAPGVYLLDSKTLEEEKEQRLYGYKKNGEWVIEPIYIFACPFHNGSAVVVETRYSGELVAKIINEEGEDITLTVGEK